MASDRWSDSLFKLWSLVELMERYRAYALFSLGINVGAVHGVARLPGMDFSLEDGEGLEWIGRLLEASIDTSKPAIRRRVKTGQRGRGVETSWGLPHAVLRRQAAVGGAGDGEGKVRMRSCVG